jgi:metallophosphoesterase superfamily enzyme
LKPYGLIADLHLHRWTAFATVDEDGVNSRLKILLDEIERAADAVVAAGGDTLIIAGDVFHVRGSVAPSVLNPVRDCLHDIADRLTSVYIIPGNHDLEFKFSSRIGNAVTTLDGLAGTVRVLDGVDTITVPSVVMVPWIENIADLKGVLESK